MKAAQIQQYGENDVIQINHHAVIPECPDDKILVHVYAAGVNPFDWKLTRGMFEKMIPLQFPMTLGGDIAGAVKHIGKNIHEEMEVGAEVFGQAHVLAGGSGAFAEFALVHPNAIAFKPEDIDIIEAAALPLTGVSALQALTDHLSLTEGQKILIHGGAGGIGSFAIQIAKALGAYVATTANTEDLDYVKSLGADVAIDYRATRFEDVVNGYDAVFDTVGGETYRRSFSVLRKNGILLSMVERPQESLMEQYGVIAMMQSTKVTRERLLKLSDYIDQRKVRVHVDKIFSLEQTAAALTYLETTHPRGKVVIKIA